MRKFSVFYGIVMLVLIGVVLVVGVSYLHPKVERAEQMQAVQPQALDVERAVDEARQQAAQKERDRQLAQALDQVVTRHLESDRKVEEATRSLMATIKEVIPAPPPEPIPTPAARVPAAFNVPSKRPAGRVYTNDDLKPDARPGRVIIKFTPEQARGIDWEEPVKTRRCAAYGFVQADGKLVNYLNCPTLVVQ